MNAYEIWKRRTIGVLKTQRISVSGLELLPQNGPGILAPNHLNWKDVFFLGAMVPRQIHFVGVYELFDAKQCYKYSVDYMKQKAGKWFQVPAEFIGRNLANVISRRMHDVGAIPVKRKGLTKDMFESVESGLKEKKLVCLFPEGGTGVVGKLKEFKKGIAKIVYDLLKEGCGHIPVFPTAIRGTHRFFLPNRSLSLEIGQPLHIEDHIQDSYQETLDRFTEHLRESVYNLLFKDGEDS